MKKYITVIAIIICSAFAKACSTPASTIASNTATVQKFVSHQVKAGETLKDIASKFGITEKEITKLNPDARTEIYEGLVLILPATSTIAKAEEGVSQDHIKFKTHKVKRKETLYSISKEYNVSQEVIKRFNTSLYSQVLRKGDKLRIPVNYKEKVVTDVTINAPESPVTYISHNVIAKETKYGIARKYGITIAELENINPSLADGLKIGDELRVPKANFAKSTIIDEGKYAFYEVQKGNTMYSLLRVFKLEADELIALNPALDEGLKEGMILKVPKGSPGSGIPTQAVAVNQGNPDVTILEGEKGSLVNQLTDFSPKRVAIMLPFGVGRVNAGNTEVNENLLRDDRILRLSLDLYSGMLMAVQDAKKAGITTIVDTYDTSYNRKDGAATNARKVENIIQSNDFSNVNAVIGPLLGKNIDRVSSILNARNIPVISPWSNNVAGGNNIFVSRPDDKLLSKKMLAYLKINGSGKNIIVIADKKNNAVLSKMKTIFPNLKTVTPRSNDKGYYLYPGDIPAQLSSELENWVLVETNDVPLISNVTTSLNGQLSTRKIVMFTTNRGNAYDSDEIQHDHLKNLAFHFPSAEKEYKYSKAKAFIDSYETMYGVSPSESAIKGYDLMYDTLLRLAYSSDLYAAAAAGVETDYVENKFKYGSRLNGGFSNDAVYLMKYTDTLELEEVLLIED